MKATPKAMAIRSFACIGTILLAGACGGGGGGGAPSGSAAVPILSPLERVIQVRAGGAHSCLLTGQGNALCWGDNTFGQLGDGTTVASATPVKVIAGAITLPFPGASPSLYQIALGDRHTCALRGAAIFCWGDNSVGQLGDSPEAFSSSPVRLNPPLAVAQYGYDEDGISALAANAGGSHTCGSLNASKIECWGFNDHGQLGGPVLPFGRVASPVPPGHPNSGWSSVATGAAHTCALTQEGDAYCWGDNSAGQLGVAGVTASITPVPLGLRFSTLAAGAFHTCGIAVSGDARTLCWGGNASGQLGDGTQVAHVTPLPVVSPVSYTKLVAGREHTCGMSANGVLQCWGSNSHGQLGIGTAPDSMNPVTVTPTSFEGRAFFDVGAGKNHTCAMAFNRAFSPDDRVYCWGANASGQLGNGTTTDSNVPVQVKGAS